MTTKLMSKTLTAISTIASKAAFGDASHYAKALDENIADLVTRLKAKQYKPQPVLRVYIPKPNGDKRPLVMPSAMLAHSRLSRTRLSRWGKFKLGRKTSPEEVQTEDDGYEYMAEAYSKSCQAERMVEGAEAKVAWTLMDRPERSIDATACRAGRYRYYESERQLPNAKELLPSGREARLQMGKLTLPEEKLQLGSVSPFHPI